MALYLPHNSIHCPGTSATRVATAGDTDVTKLFSGTEPSIAVAAGHRIELKIICPAWDFIPAGECRNGQARFCRVSIFVNGPSQLHWLIFRKVALVYELQNVGGLNLTFRISKTHIRCRASIFTM